MNKPKCDSCGCTEFTIDKVEPDRSEFIPASQYFASSYGYTDSNPAIMRYVAYVAICVNCKVEYPYTKSL